MSIIGTSPGQERHGQWSPAERRLLRSAGAASISVAIALIALKSYAYASTESVALLGSLADSMLDLLASCITFFAVRFAVEPPDREHRFGHGKSEGIAGLLQAIIITGSALYVGFEAFARFLNPAPIAEPAVGYVVMGVSIVLTAGLVAYQGFVIARTHSLAISADAAHYGSDLLSNLAVIVAIVLASRFGWWLADPLLGLVVVAIILYSAGRILRDALHVLLDRELSTEEREKIREIALSHASALGVHDIRTRSSGSMQFIQLHLELEGRLSLGAAHRISDEVEAAIYEAFPNAEVLIHLDPYGIDEPRDSF